MTTLDKLLNRANELHHAAGEMGRRVQGEHNVARLLLKHRAAMRLHRWSVAAMEDLRDMAHTIRGHA